MALSRLVIPPLGAGGPPQCRPLEDASDRAQLHRWADLERVPLDSIGYWPGNRGFGISPFHVHEIANDVLVNRTLKTRYINVEIVEITDEFLAEVRRVNVAMAKSETLMPKCFPDKIKYVCLGKTHFVHAQKLGKDGGRTLFNQGKLKIEWRSEDNEGELCITKGPMCAIYKSTLWHDADAMKACSANDNLNANVSMGEDEMQAFGRIDVVVKAEKLGKDGMTMDILCHRVLDRVRLAGLGTFTQDDWTKLIALRVALPDGVATMFQVIQCSACMSRVRVRVCDFGNVAKLNAQAPFAMVALLLQGYLGALKTNVVSDETYAGRQEVIAKTLPREQMKELMSEGAFLLDVHKFVLKMMKTYTGPKPPNKSATPESLQSSLRDARGELFANAGKIITRVAKELCAAVSKENLRFKKLSLDDRMAIISTTVKGKFGTVETRFRKKVVDLKLWEDASLPVRQYAEIVGGAQATSQAAAGGSSSGATVDVAPGGVDVDMTPGDEFGEGAGVTRLTQSHVFKDLGISDFGEDVMCRMNADYSPEERPHEIPVPQAPAQDLPGQPAASAGTINVKEEPVENATAEPAEATAEPTEAQPAELAKNMVWRLVRLKSLVLPDHAEVEVRIPALEGPGEVHVRKVRVGDLREVPDKQEKGTPAKKNLHPVLQEAGEALLKYDFQVCEGPHLRSFVIHTLYQSHMATIQNVEHLDVFCVSEPNKLPMALQVRAAADFKKGQLVIFPCGGQVLHDDEQTNLLLRRHGGKGFGDATTKGTTLHGSMLMYVDGVARSALKSLKRKKPDEDADPKEPTVATLRLVSPLLSGKDEKNRHEGCFKDLAPFWALLRTPKPSSPANMDMGVLTLKDLGFELVDHPSKYKWPRLMHTVVELPYAINKQAIQKGDILTLPFLED